MLIYKQRLAKLPGLSTQNNSLPINKRSPSHYPVLSAEKLLKGRAYAELMSWLKTLAFVPDDSFESLYQKPILDYAIFVQGLPAFQIEAFNYQGGLLELGIKRAIKSLSHFREVHPLRTARAEGVSKRQAIWSYAVFTAGLLLGLGQIVASYWVTLCELNHYPLQRWNPLNGPMLGQASLYRYSLDGVRRDDLAAKSTVVLVQSLLAREAVAWIGTEPDIFEAWLSILLNDEKHGGLFSTFILPVHARLLGEEEHRPGDIIGEMMSLYPMEEEQAFDLATERMKVPDLNAERREESADLSKISDNQLAETLIVWLRRQGLELRQREGSTQVARQFVVQQEGLILDSRLLQGFIQQKGLQLNQDQLMRRLLNSNYIVGQIQRQTHSLVGGEQKERALCLDPTLISKSIAGGVQLNHHSQPLGQTVYPKVVNSQSDVRPKQAS